MDSALMKIWKAKKTDITSGSYAEPRQFYKYAKSLLPELKYSQVQSFLDNNPAYFIFRHQKRKSGSRRYVHTSAFGDVIFCDTMYLKHLPRAGAGGIKYVFLAVDGFTNMAFGRGMKTISAKAVERATTSIMEEIKQIGLPKPKKWSFDRGSENAGIKAVIDEDMEWYYSSRFSLNKAMMAERLIAELRTYAARMLKANKEMNPLTAIMSGIEHHNKSKHSRIDMAPVDVHDNAAKALLNRRQYRWEQESKIIDQIKGPKYKVDQQVKLQVLENQFGKISDPQYHPEIYVIEQIIPTEPFYSYKIRDISSTRSLQDSVPEHLLHG